MTFLQRTQLSTRDTVIQRCSLLGVCRAPSSTELTWPVSICISCWLRSGCPGICAKQLTCGEICCLGVDHVTPVYTGNEE